MIREPKRFLLTIYSQHENGDIASSMMFEFGGLEEAFEMIRVVQGKMVVCDEHCAKYEIIDMGVIGDGEPKKV